MTRVRRGRVTVGEALEEGDAMDGQLAVVIRAVADTRGRVERPEAGALGVGAGGGHAQPGTLPPAGTQHRQQGPVALVQEQHPPCAPRRRAQGRADRGDLGGGVGVVSRCERGSRRSASPGPQARRPGEEWRRPAASQPSHPGVDRIRPRSTALAITHPSFGGAVSGAHRRAGHSARRGAIGATQRVSFSARASSYQTGQAARQGARYLASRFGRELRPIGA